MEPGSAAGGVYHEVIARPDGAHPGPLRSQPVAVLTEPVAGFEDHEIEAHWEARHLDASREHAELAQQVAGGVDPCPLPPVDRLLRQAEVPAGAPADLDDHQVPWRS